LADGAARGVDAVRALCVVADDEGSCSPKKITRGREAQWRPCHLQADPLEEVNNWLDQYRKFWEDRFDRLDEYLKELQKKDNKDE
jgi:hypothetical protein